MSAWAMVGIGFAIFFVAGFYRELSTKACLNPKAKSKLPTFEPMDEVKVLILGDQGSGDKCQAEVALAMEKVAAEKGADLVLLLGDNFIQHGIKDTDDKQIQSKFESVYKLDLPFFAVLGNHDFKGNWKAQIELTDLNPRWNMPGATYFFEAGPVAFYGINTTCSICSIFSLFKKTKKPWRIAFGHHPMVSTGRHGGMLKSEQWVIRKTKIDTYFSGHHHLLEHIKLEGVDQITSGAGGTNLNEKEERDHPGKQFYLLEHGFVWAKFTQTEALYEFYDKTGALAYQFDRDKKG